MDASYTREPGEPGSSAPNRAERFSVWSPPETFPPFDPLLANPHLITLAAYFWPRRLDRERFPVETRKVATEPEVEILVHTQRPNRKARGEAILVHGLEGSSESGYLVSLSQALLEARYVVHRTNIRSCGDSAGLCRTLYHAGITTDLRAVVGQCEQVPFVIGFSLGGNQVLKLVGEMGSRAVGRIAGAVAVSAPVDLLLSSRKMESGLSRIYARHFLKAMKQSLRRREGRLDYQIPWDRVRAADTIFAFDDCVTGPAFGFRGAEHYYETQSAKNFLDSIAIPTLAIHSMDDPMIDLLGYSHPAFRANPELTLLLTEKGGHASFLSADRVQRFWVNQALLHWLGRLNPAHKDGS